MKRTQVLQAQRLSLSLCMLCALSVSLGANATEVTVARYSTLQTSPSLVQRDPLAMPVVPVLPDSVNRIGEAVELLLEPSGYRLAPPLVVGAERAELLALPLPESHRKLGPLPLRAALKILAGPAFRLAEDPIHRLISFERCERTTGHR